MIEHLELVQESSRRHLTEVEFSHHGRVIRMRNIECECSLVADCTEVCRSKFIRLSESFPVDLTGPQLEALNELCLTARRSEEFFLTANATNQLLRTVIGHEDLHPRTWTEAEAWSKLISSIVIHSNILPCDPYLSKLWAARDVDNASVHFPSCMLKEALKEGKPLKMKLLEWKSAGKGCEIGKRGTGRFEDGDCEPRNSKLFWEIQAADVKFLQVLAKGSDGIISLITWRGGMFVRKEPKEVDTSFDAELEVVKRFSHPHIVYSFGAQLCDGLQSSYFMEYMTSDLFNFIVDRVHRSVGDNQPPFSPHDSVDVLFQIAKAMRYMHHENVNVVHCDLKSLNILLSEIATSDNALHYLVKVADFGSARLVDSSSGSAGFIPGDGTTNYTAPEALRQRSDLTVRINSPQKIDVYSFGIVAFEVLTGKNNVETYKRSPSRFKKGVIDGTERPPLREECRKHKEFTQDKDLVSLIERCWHGDPLERPSFVEICEDLDKVRVRIAVCSDDTFLTWL
jgi:serine/threonine protein kinase